MLTDLLCLAHNGRTRVLTLLAAILLSAHPAIPTPAISTDVNQTKPLLIAHRGASGYAPEHTLAAYELAIQQGADFVEQDLQITKDGALICLHDPDLARTTNVAEVFPERATVRDVAGEGEAKRGWYAVDFTLAEIKRLDAGSWFNRTNPFAARSDFSRQRIPTLEEAIKFINNRAGLYIELKHYPFYKSLGYDVAERLAATLKAHGCDKREKRDRVFIQSFYKSALLRMKEIAPQYARIQLLPMEDANRKTDTAKITPELAQEIAAYARGAGPSKAMLASAADVATLHRAGLIVHPYTFRGLTTPTSRRPLDEQQQNGSSVRQNIISDIQRYVYLGIDGGFTDYPALWKAAIEGGPKRN
ncbi:MAG TPA: glycerophosphodiester phosphodiesterase family protein [Blastocatellia bacterium]|nr:glycerophosphodiester phosphodiesterase family protein [Blastocatellia bacterium]